MLLRANQHKKMIWKNGGGITDEIARSPNNNNNEEFDWRLSMALVKAPGGPFSIYPHIDRTLCIINGKSLQLKLNYNNDELVYLDENSPPFSFPGEISITCKIYEHTLTDFNVMTRRDSFRHTVERISFKEGQSPINLSNNNNEILFIVVAQGKLEANGITMTNGDAIQFNDNNQIIKISTSNDNTIIYIVTIIKLSS